MPDNNNSYNELPQEQGFLSKLASFFLELIKIALLAGITIGLVRYFLFKPFYVKGQSMEPNFQERDYLIIDEITYRFRSPVRGDIIVFRSPVNNDHYLKRVIAVPGERVKVEGDKVIIYNKEHPQGVVVEEAYISEPTPGSVSYVLDDDQYFVLGDNRDASFDSRRFGPIDENDMVGRVWFRGWPFSRAGTFAPPTYNF
ncbi:MAG: Signal peptidase I [Candidatus Magasanikbacteria bacterium GW2011_GWA2_56_11]|uniref:Signal peptidase I n=1 Tax=Candidatus Magasanikbacteria bacterium GW2011_GWA2_56_11 TaxID=1619044 RepID=A0A0G1YGB7_9BACT|nr:MAG: Signal peptidase I [Candidatus Magasanikbacteria bacterium GW2011_GWA2_56_11]